MVLTPYQLVITKEKMIFLVMQNIHFFGVVLQIVIGWLGIFVSVITIIVKPS